MSAPSSSIAPCQIGCASASTKWTDAWGTSSSNAIARARLPGPNPMPTTSYVSAVLMKQSSARRQRYAAQSTAGRSWAATRRCASGWSRARCAFVVRWRAFAGSGKVGRMRPDLPLPTTPRLRMRRFGPADLPTLVAYRSHPEVARYQSWSAEFSLADAEQFLRVDEATTLGTRGAWTQIALVPHDADVPCGDLALHVLDTQPDTQADTVELGVTLDPAHQGKGLAAEALRAMISWLFAHHGTHRVLAQ